MPSPANGFRISKSERGIATSRGAKPMIEQPRLERLVLFFVVLLAAGSTLAGVPVRTVAAGGLGAPGTNGDTFNPIPGVVMDGIGRTSFTTFLTGPDITGDNDVAIYSEGNGFLYLWAQGGWDAPGTPQGDHFYGMGNPAMNREGKIIFYANLKGGDVNDSNREGIWSNKSGTLQLVFRKGDPAPGAPPGATFFSWSDPVMNAA